jgi:predicted lysophospholipase L1 biosynthesis ABC-type transport system permease subunit
MISIACEPRSARCCTFHRSPIWCCKATDRLPSAEVRPCGWAPPDSQVRRIVLIEAGLIGLTGYVIGALCGLVLAALLVFVINRQFFGWSIHLVLQPGIFLQAFALVAVTSLLAGLWPAHHAANRAPADAMRLD